MDLAQNHWKSSWAHKKGMQHVGSAQKRLFLVNSAIFPAMHDGLPTLRALGAHIAVSRRNQRFEAPLPPESCSGGTSTCSCVIGIDLERFYFLAKIAKFGKAIALPFLRFWPKNGLRSKSLEIFLDA